MSSEIAIKVENLSKCFQIYAQPHDRLKQSIYPRLQRLADAYELVWASGWEDRANDHLPGILGVPELPYLTFDGRAQFGTAHWKLEALDEYAGARPLAWIDDSLDESCHEWAEERAAPTLLVPTESAVGLVDAQVEALEAWVTDGFPG